LHRLLTLLLLPLVAVPSQDVPLGPAAGNVVWEPWVVLLPLQHTPGATGVGDPLPPEQELGRMRLDGPGPDLEREHAGKGGGKIRWRALEGRPVPGVLPDLGPIDFLKLLDGADERRRLGSYAAAYLHRRVRSPARVDLPIRLGSDDSVRVWVNGEAVHTNDVPRALDAEADAVVLPLERGVNHLFVKVCQGSGAWGFGLRYDVQVRDEDVHSAQLAVNAAIERGVRYLVETQQRDGSWAFHGGQYRNGQTALSLYALLESGLSPRHQAIRRGLAFLRVRPPQRTYSAACELLALAALPGEEQREWMEADTAELLDWIGGDGFGYPDGNPDLSNTQYGALGLWAARRRGIDVPRRAWRDLVLATLRHRARDGGFTYRPDEGESTGSMTAAGLSVLAISMGQLGDSGGLSPQKRVAAGRAREDGLRWLAQHFSRSTNPFADRSRRDDRWHYYYLYGLERVAALEALDRIGTVDWYWEGAAHLVGIQGPSGEWNTRNGAGETEPNTCFALLFLNRATAKLTGEGVTVMRNLYVSDETGADVVLRATGDTPLSMWITGFGQGVRERHAQLRVLRVEYLADGVVVRTVEAESDQPWRQQPLPAQYSFSTMGPHRISAAVHVVGPDGGEVVLRSSEVEVQIHEVLAEWMLDYAGDTAQNALRQVEFSASSSSRRDDAHAPALAADGSQASAWVCAADDPDPRLTIECVKPIRGNVLVFAQANGTLKDRGKLDRITKLELTLGARTQPFVVELDPDEVRKTVFSLPRAVQIRSIEVRVLAREPGSEHPGCAGLAEIEVRLLRDGGSDASGNR